MCHGGADEEAAEARAQAPPHAIRKVPPSRPPAPGRARPAPTVDSGKAAVRQLASSPDRSWSRSKSCAAAGAGAGDSAFSTCAEPGSSFCWGPVLQGSTSPSSSRSSTLGQADRARCANPPPPLPLARAPATLPAPRTDPAPSRRLACTSRFNLTPFCPCVAQEDQCCPSTSTKVEGGAPRRRGGGAASAPDKGRGRRSEAMRRRRGGPRGPEELRARLGEARRGCAW